MRTARGALAILAAIAGLGAVAYAASPRSPHPGSTPTQERSRGTASLPRPKITGHPDKVAPSASARFGFTARLGNPRFQCRLDGRAWGRCRSPVTYAKLATGIHKFSVRVTTEGGGHGPAARFRWRVLEPKAFSIVPQLSGLGALYPGAPAQPLPVIISNPNPVPILVTSLGVTTTASPSGCASAENLLLTGAGVSAARPVKVPAGSSVSLPAPGVPAPSIALRDLPANQDACQNAQFPLSFSGRARG